MLGTIVYPYREVFLSSEVKNSIVEQVCVHNEVKAKQSQTTQLHPGQLFFSKEKGAALGVIGTYNTLLSRRALYQRSYKYQVNSTPCIVGPPNNGHVWNNNFIEWLSSLQRLEMYLSL